ncbi:ATP-dependent DNA helicase [Candidatus Woesearchaeota archaeon]|nr:ATP-dependent DNA helicase [Candidatus Woesearchaeota archaeon]
MIKEAIFPYDKIRKTQDEMLLEVADAIKNKKNLIAHAPTGIGKTVSVLAPALSFALKNDLTIFFLTSRHTQHQIAVKTLKEIRKKHNQGFCVVDILGKKWMCLQGGVNKLYSNEFSDYCKRLREENECEFYSNIRSKGKLSFNAEKVLEELKKIGASHSEELIKICEKENVCPYEISTLLCKDAQVVIGDYYHVFNENIRTNLFKRGSKELEKSIIIVDEGHNLPGRIMNLGTVKLSNLILERALKEAVKFKFDEAVEHLNLIRNALDFLAEDLNFNKEEKLVKKHEFIEKIEKEKNYEEIISDLIFIGDEVREKQKQSFIGSIGNFLEAWKGPDKGFARIISLKEGFKFPLIILSYRCLDPSLITKEVIENAYSTIIMSGTLTPTFMYKDILGFDNVIERVYGSPFPKKNKLSLIIPETTTKFTRRSEAEFEKIAKISAKLVNSIPGNSLLFFPSYNLRDNIYKHFHSLCEKTTFLEKPNLSKQEKEEMLERFGSYSKIGAVLLGVAAGSFGEGIDLPGDLLKAVIVIGLPLEKPSLEIKELIDYYDEKFGKGWDYGYMFPAIIKCLQNAGRCIRSETDRGVIVFLDERFAWQNYYKCFPPDMDVKITKLYEDKVKDFFKD